MSTPPETPDAEPRRRRLSTEQRREQLLRVGVELFARHPYEDVWIEQVAELAQVSRGLLYHYFPNKRVFFAAVVRHEGERMLRLTESDSDAPVRERLIKGLDAYLTYAQEHAHGFRAFHQAAAAGDPEIRAAYEASRAEQERRIVEALTDNADALGLAEQSPEMLRLAVRGWLSFIVALCVEWLDQPDLPRDAVRDLCIRTMFGAVVRNQEG